MEPSQGLPSPRVFSLRFSASGQHGQRDWPCSQQSVGMDGVCTQEEAGGGEPL